jgi:hypothetical protein
MVRELDPDEAIEVEDDGELMMVKLSTGARTLISDPQHAQHAQHTSAKKGAPAAGKWLAYAHWTNGTGAPVSSFTAKWRVPKDPITKSGQSVFLFNGATNLTNKKHGKKKKAIIQPVLQWGATAAGGGPYWAIASWIVTLNEDNTTDHAFYTKLTRVEEGDELTGFLTAKESSSPHGFGYECGFEGSHGIQVVGTTECNFWVVVLEAYDFSEPSHLPDSPLTAFTSIEVKTGGANPSLSWKKEPMYRPVNIVKDGSKDAEIHIQYQL